MSLKGANLAMPALMKIASRVTPCSASSAARRRLSPILPWSLCRARVRPPMLSRALSRVAWSRPVMMTRAPSLAYCRAAARPMPLLPPVTRTVLLSKRFMMVSLARLVGGDRAERLEEFNAARLAQKLVEAGFVLLAIRLAQVLGDELLLAASPGFVEHQGVGRVQIFVDEGVDEIRLLGHGLEHAVQGAAHGMALLRAGGQADDERNLLGHDDFLLG